MSGFSPHLTGLKVKVSGLARHYSRSGPFRVFEMNFTFSSQRHSLTTKTNCLWICRLPWYSRQIYALLVPQASSTEWIGTSIHHSDIPFPVLVLPHFCDSDCLIYGLMVGSATRYLALQSYWRFWWKDNFSALIPNAGRNTVVGSEPMAAEVSDDSFWDIQRDELDNREDENSALIPVGKSTHIGKIWYRFARTPWNNPLTVSLNSGHIDSLARKVESFILGTYPTSLSSRVVQQALSYSKYFIYEIAKGHAHIPDRALGHDTPCPSCNKFT